MNKLFICSAAEIDYTESLCWYAERSLQAANDFDSELQRAFREILEGPNRFPKCDERHHFLMMRRFPFQVIYRLKGDTVEIIAIAHTSRQSAYWKNR